MHVQVPLGNRYFFAVPNFLWWLLIVGGMTLLAVFAFGPSDVAGLAYMYTHTHTHTHTHTSTGL